MAKSTVHRRRKGQRGFALIVVLILLALLAATVTLALRDASTSLAETARSKSSEIVYADLSRGLSDAMAQVESIDPVALIDPNNRYDLFKNPPDPAFPVVLSAANAAGTYAVPITVGLRPGQRTQPPPGEDVRTSYGYVIEIQLQADVDTAAAPGLAPAQERVSVGVRLPGVLSHSN